MSKLIICVDGLGHDLISKKNTPFLWNFGKKNYFSELETLFATTGIEYCFFTGKTPEQSKIWLEFAQFRNSIFNNWVVRFLSFNKTLRTYFGALLQLVYGRTFVCGLHNIPKDKLKYFDVSVKEGLWKFGFFKKKFSFYKWPFFVTRNKKKIIFNYENDEQRLERLLKEKNKEIYYTQLMSVDKTIHKFGKKSKQTKKIIKKLDEILERYVNNFIKENENPEIFIWSDHGFADIQNYIDVKETLSKKKDLIYFVAGTTLHFWFENKEIEKEIEEIIGKIPELTLLDSKLKKKYKIPEDEKYGDLIYFVEKGNYIFPNFYQKSEKEKFESMHDYPGDKELNGFFISNKKIPKKLKMWEVRKFLE